MRIALMLIIMASLGCQRGPKRDIVGIEPAMQPYYDIFNAAYGLHVMVPIAFVSIKAPTVGKCTVFDDGYKQIAIEPSYWMNATEAEKKELVFHELAHCVFGRTHNHNYLLDGCPASITNPYVFGDPCISLHWTEYINELPHAQAGDHL